MTYIKNIKLLWIPLYTILLAIILIITYSPISIHSLQAQKGEIDLSELENATIVNLKGEWLYFENLMIQDIEGSNNSHYVTVPHEFEGNEQYQNQPFGVATYQLRATGLKPNTYYGVHIINEVSAYRLTVNGIDIIKAGEVGYSKETHKPEMKSHVGYFQPNEEGNAQFLLEISNFSHNSGGFWKNIKIGSQETIAYYNNHQTGFEIFSFSLIFTFGFFFLILFSINREQKSLLFFSIFCLLIALRIMLTNNKQFYVLIYDIPWEVAVRLEFLGGYLLLPFAIFFILSLNYIKKPKFITEILLFSIVCLFILTLFTPNRIYANFLDSYMWICVISMPFLLYMIMKGIQKRKTGSPLILLGALCFTLTTLIDFFGQLDYYLLAYGTFIMLLFFSMVVMYEFFMLKQKHDYLESEIMKDPLTEIKNRFYLNLLINQGLPFPSGSSKYYIFFFDLNKFKVINDTFGHNVGDAILVESARRIQHYFSAPSDIVCRYGGDEFLAITLSKETPAAIEKLAENIIAHFKEPFHFDGNEYFLGVSIGIAEYDGTNNLEKVINDSDSAMYEAKKQQTRGIIMVKK